MTFYDMRTGNEITETEHTLIRNMGGGHFLHADVSARAESAFLSAIISVTNTSPVHIGFTHGYGEGQNPRMEQLLEFNAYEVRTVNITTAESVAQLKELDFLVIYAPSVDYSTESIREIESWLNNDGNFGKTLLYFAHPTTATPNLDTYFRNIWNVSVERAYVDQTDLRFISAIEVANWRTEVQHFLPHMFAQELNPAMNILGTQMRHVIRTHETTHGNHAVTRTFPLLSSNPGAVVIPFETGRDDFDFASAQTGVFDVGAMSTIETHAENSFDLLTSSVLVFGGTNVFMNELLIRANTNNEAFLLSMLNELSGKDSDVPVLSAQSFTIESFEINREQANIIGFIFAILLPLVLFIFGTGIWIRRIRA
jgi:hypothetical protein